MKRIIFRKRNFMMLFMSFSILLGITLKVEAAKKPVLLIQGVMETDIVELYKIASYDDGAATYTWTEPVQNWLTQKGSAYSELTPNRLRNLPETRALEFTGQLLIGLQTSLKGVEADISKTGEEEYEIQTAPGIYLILPIGTTRVYTLKWIVIEPDQNPQKILYMGEDQLTEESQEDIIYDYEYPTVEVFLENLMGERDYMLNPLPDEETEPPFFVINDDQIQVKANVKIPFYSSIYAMEKRINNIYVAIPKGVQYIDKSLELSVPETSEDANDKQISLTPDVYGLQSLEDAVVYEYQSEPLFFKVGQWYYNFDGSTLITNVSDEEALRKYLVEKGLEDEDESKEENKESFSEETESEITMENLVISEGWTIFIFSLSTDMEWKEVNVSYRVQKNDESNDTGIYPLKNGLLFSVSPLNTSLRGYTAKDANMNSLGIKVTVIQGTSFSKYSSMEELLELEEKLTDVEFSIYQFTGRVFEDNEGFTNEFGVYEMHNGEEHNDSVEDMSEENEESPEERDEMIYQLDEDGSIRQYRLVAVLTPNEKKYLSIGGLEKKEYLVKQTKFQTGYTYAAEAFLIKEEDWDKEELMEGNQIAALVWMNFPTAYLPATGKAGIGTYVKIGVFVGVIALIGMFIKLLKEIKGLKQLIKQREEEYKKQNDKQQELLDRLYENEKGELL